MYLYHSKTIKFSYHNNAKLITVNIASLNGGALLQTHMKH